MIALYSMRDPCVRTAAILCAWSAAALPVAVCAADLDVQVNGANGAPVPGAVVTVHLVGQPTPRPRPAGVYAIDQQDIQFRPFVSTVPVGASVMFMNHDSVRHHVYSFSPPKRFQLKLAGRQQNQSVLFDKAGIVPLGCNIHDRMIAYIDVVDTPWAKTADANGRVVLHGIPAGAVSVSVWHPYLRAPGNSIARTVTLSDAGTRVERFVAGMRTPPRDPGTGY
jgi:plastocyanin